MIHDLSDHGRIILNDGFVFLTGYCMHLRVEQTRLWSFQFIIIIIIFVVIMCRNDEWSLMMSWVDCLLKDSVLFILFAENSQILLKISVIPILLTFMYLVALNLFANNQLNSSLRQKIGTTNIAIFENNSTHD